MGFAILWWVAASVLVFFSWNRVVAALFKVAKVKWWHPFLVIATVAVLLAPCGMRKGRHEPACGHGAKAAHCMKRGHGAERHHAGGDHCEKCKGEAAGEKCEHCKKQGAAKAKCGGECKGKCDGKCAGKCEGGDCAGGRCPHGH